MFLKKNCFDLFPSNFDDDCFLKKNCFELKPSNFADECFKQQQALLFKQTGFIRFSEGDGSGRGGDDVVERDRKNAQRSGRHRQLFGIPGRSSD